MPAEPTIVAPTPTINQGTDLTNLPDTSPGLEQVQAVFEKVMPWKGDAPKPLPPEPAKAKEAAPEPVKPAAEPEKKTSDPVKQPDKQVEAKVEDHKMPSFLEDALKPESEPKPPVAQVEEEWSEELPKEERQSKVKSLRDAYKKAKDELQTLKSRPVSDDAAQARLQVLEAQNKDMATTLARVGVQQDKDFQQNVIRPLYGAWNEAARIVKDAGGDPQNLAKAMSLTGKAQFEALDTLFADMPESAKAEAHDALRDYRKFEKVRQTALANAPQTFEFLQKQELQRQHQLLSQQKEGMKTTFDSALKRLRDDAKLEVLQRSSDPNDSWWNTQGESIEKNARSLYLENTDMDKMAIACVLAPAVDAYRKMWIASEARAKKAEATLKDKFGAEPSLSESSGANGDLMPSQQLQDDLKKPFTDVFLREFRKAQARNR